MPLCEGIARKGWKPAALGAVGWSTGDWEMESHMHGGCWLTENCSGAGTTA